MIRLFRVFIPTSLVMLVLSELALITGCLLLATFIIVPEPDIYLLYDEGLQRLGLVVLSFVVVMYLADFYTDLRFRKTDLVQRLATVIGMVLILQALITYLQPELMLSRWVMLTGSALVLFLLPAWRMVFTRSIYKALGAQRILFLGSNWMALAISERAIANPQIGFEPLGFVDDQYEPGQEVVSGVKALARTADLRTAVQTTKPDRVVVALYERRNSLPVYPLLELRFEGYLVEEAAAVYERVFGRVPVKELRPSQLIFTPQIGQNPYQLRLQLAYSTLIGVIGFLLTLPIMILVAIAVKLTSPGPILYRQTRVGYRGQPFTLLKFRSMTADAEAKTGAVWAAKQDPRVTPLGKWLRKLRLDELPQFINVLRGEMSIVGPRPERPEFVKMLTELIPFYQQRHYVRPGITGWAQINFKYGETIEDTMVKLEYDLYYIKNVSPSLDAYIMFQTAKVMFLSGLGQ